MPPPLLGNIRSRRRNIRVHILRRQLRECTDALTILRGPWRHAAKGSDLDARIGCNGFGGRPLRQSGIDLLWLVDRPARLLIAILAQ